MADPIEAFPLTWPAGVARSRSRHRAQFTQTVTSAQDGLMRELRMLGASNIVVSSDVGPRKNDGMLYARANMNPADPGVAVYFARKGKQVVFACDKWHGVHNNIHAIAKTIEALRGIERWGSAEMMDAAFTGFAALPAPSVAPARHWSAVLGVPPNATVEDARAAYRRLIRDAHPDTGGSDEKATELNLALERALEASGG